MYAIIIEAGIYSKVHWDVQKYKTLSKTMSV